MKTIKYQEVDIAYEVEGKGPDIVLLHGFCEDRSIWENFRGDLLEEQYRVTTIDLPGFGDSGRLPSPSIGAMAQAVRAVLEELDLSDIVVIGHSMGGYVALAYAEQGADGLVGLGLFHSHPYADTEEKKETRTKSIDFINRQGHILYVKQMIPNLFEDKFARSNAFLLDKLIFNATRYDSGGITDALQAMRDRPDRSEVLRGLSCPVLFIIGKEDGAIPHEMSMAQTHLPRTASIHLLDKVGHMGMFEAERAIQKIVRDFAEFCRQLSTP